MTPNEILDKYTINESHQFKVLFKLAIVVALALDKELGETEECLDAMYSIFAELASLLDVDINKVLKQAILASMELSKSPENV